MGERKVKYLTISKEEILAGHYDKINRGERELVQPISHRQSENHSINDVQFIGICI